MKKILLLSFSLLTFFVLSAQVPQGFNYQGLAKNSDGSMLDVSEVSVRIGILSGSTLIWQEDHSAVPVNASGVFSLIIGDPDASKTGGSASSFAAIPWGNGSLSVEVSLDAGSGYTSMGTAPLMSVPYAMFAANQGSSGSWSLNEDTLFTLGSVGIGTTTPNKSLLSIQSIDSQVDKPLFEVKNDLGNPVFAVYNDGVMVYVDENKKGVKGGFAVGGYSNGKNNITQEYLRITPDSVRIWVPEESKSKGVKGGFAVGGYSASKATSQNFLEVSSTNTSIFFDTTAQLKGTKGGFAVGGYNKSKKGSTQQLMSLTSDNYLIGQNAGLSLTSGRNNTFFGWEAGKFTTTGGDNVFIGKDAGHENNEGKNNVMIGFQTGYNNNGGNTDTWDGNYNVFLGEKAG